jgi:hypothetical protein
MSVNASVQQMAIGLAATVAGAVVGEGADGELTGYAVAGIIAAVSTGISMVLAGWIRLAKEVPQTSVAVDSPDDSPVFREGERAEPAEIGCHHEVDRGCES